MTRADRLCDRIVHIVEDADFGAHGVHVLCGDDEAAFRWTPDVREEIHSVAKAVCALAAGLAADEGAVSLDAPVAELLPDAVLGDGVETVTLRHLLSMTSGIDLPWSATMMTDWPDLAAEFLSRPSRGRVFQYSNASAYTAMHALSERVGDIALYVGQRLFAPLGIDDVPWRRCPNGRVLAGEGISLRTDEIARIGRLVRDGGVWRGRRVVAREATDALHTPWVVTGGSGAYARYGHGGWDGPGRAWRLHGAHGQLVIFVGDAVITLTAHDHGGADGVAAQIAELVAG